jgi:hypothetical protein
MIHSTMRRSQPRFLAIQPIKHSGSTFPVPDVHFIHGFSWMRTFCLTGEVLLQRAE